MAGRSALALVFVLAIAGAVAYLAAERPGTRERDRVVVGPPDDGRLIERLLARRARALEAADAGALAATARGRQRALDRRHARRLRGLGVRQVGLRLEALEVDESAARLQARLTYRVSGVAGRFGVTRRMTALRTGDGWRIASVRGSRGRPPWEVAPMRRHRSPHFVVWAPSAIDPGAGGLLVALEAGYSRMREVLTRGRLRRRYLVVVAGGASQGRALTAQIRGIGSLAAITDTEVRQEGPAQRVVAVASQRLLVLWPPFLALAPDSRQIVVAHELTHAALAGSTSGRTPAWLVEGLALYVSGDRRRDEAASFLAAAEQPQALSLRGLSHPEAIARFGGSAQSTAYAYSSAAAFYIVERYGQDALLDLYDAFNDESLRGEAGDPRLTDRALRRVLRISLPRLERALRADLRGGGAG